MVTPRIVTSVGYEYPFLAIWHPILQGQIYMETKNHICLEGRSSPSIPPISPQAGGINNPDKGVIADCYDVLNQVFGHAEYKGKQKEIVETAVHGADIFVLAPTGMGKSLCFQIPAVAKKSGITIVASPLLALMKNQVENLRQKGIAAVSLTSDTLPAQKVKITEDLLSGHPANRLLYTTPEKLCTPDFLNILDSVYEEGELNRLVVDEAHCISEWGHDFRAEYRRLGIFRKRFKNVPIMALTATATSSVQLDIIRSLRMSEDRLYRALHPFNRDNLFYEVRYLSAPEPVSQMADIFEYITTLYRRRGRPSSGIIYCRKRAMCDELSSYLRTRGLRSKPYHRGIGPRILDKTLEDWTTGSGDNAIHVVVATIAFGLGIDKGDVRYIIHYDMPKSLEGYYQETGRAGRDGAPSKCILYYSRQDAQEVRNWVTSSHARRDLDGPPPSQRAMDSLAAFAETTNLCRHVSICRYFGEHINSEDVETIRRYCDNMCDVCKYPDKTKRRSSKLSESIILEPPPSNPPEQRLPPRPAQDGEWRKRLRDGDDDDASPLNYKPYYGGIKRLPGPVDKRPNTKKLKASYAPPLVTKPFGSVSSLSKPFRPPLKMLAPKTPSLRLDLPPAEVLSVLDHQSEVAEDKALNLGPVTPTKPTDQNDSNIDITTELEAPFSTKLPLSSRLHAFNSLRRALCGISKNWKYLNDANFSAEARDSIISAAARELEFNRFSMSSTKEWYVGRVDDSVEVISKDVVPLLTGQSEDDEDAQEIVDLMKRVCASHRRQKGKEKVLEQR